MPEASEFDPGPVEPSKATGPSDQCMAKMSITKYRGTLRAQNNPNVAACILEHFWHDHCPYKLSFSAISHGALIFCLCPIHRSACLNL